MMESFPLNKSDSRFMAGDRSAPAPVCRLLVLVLVLAAAAPSLAFSEDSVYRYKNVDGAKVYTDDPQLIPQNRKSGVTVTTAPALPSGITPPTQEEKAKAAGEKKKADAEKREIQRKRTAESYKKLMDQKKQAAYFENLEKARKAYDAEKAKLMAEDAALKEELAELTELKAETGSLEKRKRNPRLGRRYRVKVRSLEEATKSYDTRRADLDARMKAFAAKKRP